MSKLEFCPFANIEADDELSTFSVSDFDESEYGSLFDDSDNSLSNIKKTKIDTKTTIKKK